MISRSMKLAIIGGALLMSAVVMVVLFYVVQIVPMEGAIKWVVAAVIATDVVMGIGFLLRAAASR